MQFDTLPSPETDDTNEDVADDIGVDMLKHSLAEAVTGFVKSSVNDCGGGRSESEWFGGLTRSGIGARAIVFVAAGGDGSGRGGCGGAVGPRRKRAWPVRLRMEMTFLNLETA